MGIGSVVSRTHTKTENSATVNKLQQYLALDFQYIDKTHHIQIENRVRFLSTDTISYVATQFLELDEISTVSPDRISLIAISLGGICFDVRKQKPSQTLEELKIKSGSLLCFEPSKLENRCNSSLLLLFSPDDNTRQSYPWNEKSTTLNMLLDYTIKIFSLYSIEPSNIQLCTFWNENLNQLHNSEKRLSDLKLTNYSSIFVTIKNVRHSNTYGQDICVHVTTKLHNEILFFASTMDSLLELQHQIARRFPRCYSVDIQFWSCRSGTFIRNNLNRKLQELDIEPDDSINAIVKDDLVEKQIRTTNRRIEKLQSSSLSREEHIVIIQLQISASENVEIEVSSEDSVIEVVKKIEEYRKNESKTNIHLYSESIHIDDLQSRRSLADFGVKPGTTMYASITGVNKNVFSIQNTKINLSTKSLKEDQNPSKPIGLINLHNTCFMNSALQCLLHVAPLTQFFLEGFARTFNSKYDHNGYDSFDKYGEMTGAYAELIYNMRVREYTNSDNDQSWKPLRMKEIIGCRDTRFATSDQQDAQEFITLLLGSMHEELKETNKSSGITIIQRLFFGILQSKVTCLNCNNVNITTNHINFLPLSLIPQQRTFKINFLTNDGIQHYTEISVNANGRIEDLVQTFLENHQQFYSLHRIIVIGAKSAEQLPFGTLLKHLSEDEVTLIEQDIYTVSIESNRYDVESRTVKLQECLEGFISVEQLDDLVFCEQSTCRRKTHATKQLSFQNLPEVIIIQLKRFSCKNGLREKLDTYVDYPINGLDLSGLLSESSSTSEKQNAIYNLIAVCNHSGSIYSGHYTAYARQDPNIDKWYEFNDSFVSVMLSERYIISNAAYLLFYMKQTT